MSKENKQSSPPQKPSVTVLNNPGEKPLGGTKGQVPTMENPPSPPAKKK